MHLRPGGGDVLGRRAARPRILRQAAGHQHDAGATQRLRLVHRAAVVVAHFGAARAICDEHAAAAIAGQVQARIAHRARGALEADASDLAAPGIDGANVLARAGIDDLEQIALLADRRRVQRQPAVIGRKIAHQASKPRVASTAFIRSVASSGFASRPALSARRNNSAK